jgi:hypothetical protein
MKLENATSNQSQTYVVRFYMENLRDAVRRIGIYTRNADKNLFDHIVFGLLSKAFSIADAALLLIENHHPEEAFGLIRSLVECAFNLRYLTQEPLEYHRRALAFAKWFYKEQQYWLHQAKEFLTDVEILAEVDKYAQENGITPDAKAAVGSWSGLAGFVWQVCKMDHPLDGSTNSQKHRKIEFATDYHLTSGYVHCSLAAIEGMLPCTGAVYDPRWRSEGREQQGQKTLYISVLHIHSAVRYVLFSMGVENTEEVNQLFSQALAQLQPLKRLHR